MSGVTHIKLHDTTAESIQGFPLHQRYHYFTRSQTFRHERCGTLLQETPWSNAAVSKARNGFVDGVVQAYNHHHNLLIRPDDVWLAIATQFVIFMNGASEELRSRFVDHAGKKHLEVATDDSMNDSLDYGALILEMAKEKLAGEVRDTELCDWILPAFSTTTKDDLLVGSVLLMAGMKSYFSYSMRFRCGIPNVQLWGTKDDWEVIRARLQKLRTFGAKCTEWADMLEKVLSHFVSAVQGQVDLDFWRRICHYSPSGSGPEYISGWISVFCVFGKDGVWQGDTRSLETNTGIAHDLEFPVIEVSEVPAGFVSAPISIIDNETQRDAMLFAGHAVYTAHDEYTIRPMLSWGLFLKDGQPMTDPIYDVLFR